MKFNTFSYTHWNKRWIKCEMKTIINENVNMGFSYIHGKKNCFIHLFFVLAKKRIGKNI